jgi:hypothetical protein
MHSDSGLHFERSDDELIVQSEPTSAFTKWIGALFAGFALCWNIAWNRIDGRSEVAYWLVLTFGMILIVVSVSIMLPRSVIPIFDLRSRRTLRRVNIFGWPYRTRARTRLPKSRAWASSGDQKLTNVIPCRSLRLRTAQCCRSVRLI